jgi:magnesium chelatase family protein
LLPAQPGEVERRVAGPDLAQVKGQETAKRALEIAAAGGHNLLMTGPPGAGKSLLAACLPGILPELTAAEALEVSMVASVAGQLDAGKLIRARPFRAPHHSASMPALVGGGLKAVPARSAWPTSASSSSTSSPSSSVPCWTASASRWRPAPSRSPGPTPMSPFPARVQLIAAMNPCRCGHLGDAALACSRAPRCAADYQARVSGPLLDRIDLHVEVQAVAAADLVLPPPSEGSAEVAARVAARRDVQTARYAGKGPRTNAEADGALLEEVATPDEPGPPLLAQAAEAMRLSARGFHRVMRVARTIADLAAARASAASMSPKR